MGQPKAMKFTALLLATVAMCSALETKVEADMKYDILSGGEVVPSGKFACQTRCKTECSMVPPKAYPLRTLQLSRHCLNHCGGLCRQLCAKFKVHRICNGCVRQCFQSCALPRDPEKGMCVAKCWGGCGSRYRGGVQAHERTGAGAIDPHNVALRPITFLEEGNVGQKI